MRGLWNAGIALFACILGAGLAGCEDECPEGYALDEAGICVAASACEGVSCGDHGTCEDDSGEALCVCDEGYLPTTHETCATSTSCDEADCGAHGHCFMQLDGGYASCLCDEGYEGNPCHECDEGYSGYDCRGCAEGYVRTTDGLCDIVASCDGIECGAHGRCDASSGSATCVCDEGYDLGWDGSSCDGCAPGYMELSDECFLSPTCHPGSCSGHGECLVDELESYCECDGGYYGWNCSCGPDTCEGDQLCDAGGSDPVCICPYSNCLGECSDLGRNEEHCGSCERACDAGELCILGGCQASTGEGCDYCGEGSLCCAGPGGLDECLTEEELLVRDTNCGGCGIQCGDNERCDSGVCVVRFGQACEVPVDISWNQYRGDLCDFPDNIDFDPASYCPGTIDGGSEAFFMGMVWRAGTYTISLDSDLAMTALIYRASEADACTPTEVEACLVAGTELELELDEGDVLYFAVLAQSSECGWFEIEMLGREED